jgi:hypothetical protein
MYQVKRQSDGFVRCLFDALEDAQAQRQIFIDEGASEEEYVVEETP